MTPLDILKQLFGVPEVADIRRCRFCTVPVLHMEHLTLEEAQDLEKSVRTLLGQDGEEWREVELD